jgi:2-phospho-L-lactate guanylyltransferase
MLDPEERWLLVLTMLEDILDTLEMVEGIQRIMVIGSQMEVKELATRYGAEYLMDKGSGLNIEIAEATDWAISHGAREVLVLPGDIPLVRPRDIENIQGYAETGDCIVLTPSRDGGTNALLRKPPDIIPPRFGPNSFQRHIMEAKKRGVRLEVYESPQVSLDMDHPIDLDTLLREDPEVKTTRLVREKLTKT